MERASRSVVAALLWLTGGAGCASAIGGAAPAAASDPLPEEVAAVGSQPRWAVDVGAQLRFRGDFARNEQLGSASFAPRHDESQFLQRSRLRGSIYNADLGIALHAQGQWYGRWGDTENQSDLDLYTACFDWHDPSGWGLPVTLRLGRQDFSYGSAFFLGRNDFYNGLSWDGLRASVAPSPDIDVDVIAATLAPLNDGDDVIRADGGHVDLGYTFVWPWHPRVFSACALGSGHDDIDSERYGEFHGNVFNDNHLVGDIGVVADLSGVTVGDVHASGMHVGVGGVSVHPADAFELSFDVHRFVAFDSPSGFSSDLGFELNLVATYRPNGRVSALAGLNRFYTGRFYEQAAATGSDVQYAYVQTQIEIDGRRVTPGTATARTARLVDLPFNWTIPRV